MAAIASAAATLVSLDLVADKFEFKSVLPRLAVVETLEKSRIRLERHRVQRPDVIRIAFLGDSTVVGPPKPRRPSDRLAHHLRHRDHEHLYQIVPFAFPGMFAATFYHAAEFDRALDPNIVILPFNLISFNRDIEANFGRPELAGWTRPQEIFEAARLPFHRSGLTLDEMLLYVGIVRSGLGTQWIKISEKQVRIVSGLEAALVDANGPRKPRDPAKSPGWLIPDSPRPRETAMAVDRRYGDALKGLEPDHETIRVFAAAVDLYRRSGAQVLAYVIPINYQHIESVGRWDEKRMKKTVESIRSAVEASGGAFVDLHRSLPDSRFKDGAGHHTDSGRRYGTDRIAQMLAPAVIALAESSSESDR